MNLDVQIFSGNLTDVPGLAQSAEDLGFKTLWLSETQHDPFLPGPLIAEHTQHLRFGTAVAISFARSPAVLAYTSWDLAQASKGRFILGLGTQVKGHIERRAGQRRGAHHRLAPPAQNTLQRFGVVLEQPVRDQEAQQRITQVLQPLVIRGPSAAPLVAVRAMRQRDLEKRRPWVYRDDVL